MSDMSIPERPLQPPHYQDVPIEAFDETCDDHLKQLFPHARQSFRDAVQNLLMLRRSIHMTEESFGLDPLKALEMAREDLNKLAEAVNDEWRDL